MTLATRRLRPALPFLALVVLTAATASVAVAWSDDPPDLEAAGPEAGAARSSPPRPTGRGATPAATPEREQAAPAARADPADPDEPDLPLGAVPLGGSTSAGDHPDPSLLITASGAWAYSTNHDEMHVPVAAVGPDGILGSEHDALPDLPGWASESFWFNWAPSVTQVGGTFSMYYATLDRASQTECISVATATDPAGPFTDRSAAPLICPSGGRGAIDPSPVHADGELWLTWKQEATSASPNSIWIQQLDATGTALSGTATQLLAAEEPWEGGVIEAPSMTRVDGRWYLMYSGNDWTDRGYATGLATCASITGPCQRVSPYAQISGGTHQPGSGGAEFSTDPAGRLWVIYHSWGDDGLTWHDGGERRVHIARAEIDGGRLTINATSLGTSSTGAGEVVREP